MKKMIAYCGLDCEKCEAHIATVKDDDALRRKVAQEWSELNNVEITAEMINCMGCRVAGVKTPYCDSMCEIRQCAMKKGFETCAQCSDMKNCEFLSMVLENSKEASNNLRTARK